MNKLSKEEQDFVNGLLDDGTIESLSEKLDDGKPRYVFAKGKEDGEFHVYDMKSEGASLARLHGCSGGGLRGSDLVPRGNGYMYTSKGRGYEDLGECSEDGEEIFWMEECGEVGKTKACYQTCSPLTFDLNGDDNFDTSDRIIRYDIDGNGLDDDDYIYNTNDAVLVFDKDGDGVSGADGSECFGNNTDLDGDGKADGYKDGFEALKALAKKEGLIGEGDDELDADDLKKLEENYGLKIKTQGYLSEAQSLDSVGITNIKLANTDKTSMTDNFDGKGNQLMQQEGATFTINGETRSYADVWHQKGKQNDMAQTNGSTIDGNNSAAANTDDASALDTNTNVNVDLTTVKDSSSTLTFDTTEILNMIAESDEKYNEAKNKAESLVGEFNLQNSTNIFAKDFAKSLDIPKADDNDDEAVAEDEETVSENDETVTNDEAVAENNETNEGVEEDIIEDIEEKVEKELEE